jgi:putative phage-type endonuclease
MSETQQESRAEWLQARRRGIGGSDVAPILGLSKWRSRLDVYLEKTGQVSSDQADSEPMLWGRLLEPIIREEFAKRSGLNLVEPPPILMSKDHPFMIASLDGLTDCGAVVECKTARSADGWGEPGSDEIPVYYTTQVAHYMAVTGAQVAYVPVLIGASDFRIYTVPREDSFIADLIEAERLFWKEHVLAGVPPEPINAADAAKLWARDNGETIEVEPELADDIEELKHLKATAKELDERIGSIEDRLKIACRDASAIAVGGKTLATYKAQTRKSLDTKALEAAHKELADQYRKESTFRVFRLK